MSAVYTMYPQKVYGLIVHKTVVKYGRDHRSWASLWYIAADPKRLYRLYNLPLHTRCHSLTECTQRTHDPPEFRIVKNRLQHVDICSCVACIS